MSPARPAPTPAGERLPLDLKLAFGAPTFASAALVLPIVIHLPKFYADQALVPLGLLAVAIGIGRAFDAVTDPLVGWLSDHTRTRWGRRRPYLALGPPLCAVSLWLLFVPPASLSGVAAAWWFCGAYVLYHLFHTAYLVPHIGLGAELSLDSHERSVLFSYREAFMVLGTLSAALAPMYLTELLGSERDGLAAFAAIFSGLLVVLYGWLTLRVRERPEFQRLASNPFVPGIRRSLRNGPFRLLLITSVLAAVPGALTATLLRFFTEEVLRPTNPALWLALLLGTYFGMAALSLPVWLRMTRRYGKKQTWLASFVFCGGGTLPMLALGEGDALWMVLLLGCSGAGFGAISVLSLAIKADVIDYDQLLTGRRREAQFGAFWSFLPKFVTIPGAAVPMAALGSLGYAPGQVQSPEVVDAIRAMLGLTPAACFAVAFWLGRRLPMDEPTHCRVLEGIAAHARGETAVDPVRQLPLAPPALARVPEKTAWFLDHFSAGELGRWQRRGGGRVVRDVALWAAGWLALAALAFGFVIDHLHAMDAEPGALVVLVGTAGGLALCGAFFHGMRLGAALRLRRDAPPREAVALHLLALSGVAGDGAAAPLETGTAPAEHS